MMSHRGNGSQYKLLFHLSDAKTFSKMYSLTEFSRKSYLCCGRYSRFEITKLEKAFLLYNVSDRNRLCPLKSQDGGL